ncbi:hypothetical protein [Sinorhizobium meliloti]|uniref:hypothetical protein n=1 Tax=Rhizobium meliloti TaxID=382 RepID=UPI0012949E73|nr:hypothetical protein [Sinorhizobium meliloti]MQX90272.1 hypothetical protein [Sinorhizobium meliloti]
MQNPPPQTRDAPADTDAAQSAIERLVRALEPFAKIGDYMRYTPPARSVSIVYMAVEADGINSHGSAKETVAAFREARAALTAYRAEEPRA